MSYPTIAVSVIMERVALDNPWQSEKWQPGAVVPDEDSPGSPARLLIEDSVGVQWLHPGFTLALHTDEAEGYYLNLSTGRPFVFVNWDCENGRGVPRFVTASYNEAARMMDGGATVEGVPMPRQWIAWLGEFVQKFYRPEQKKKRIRPPSFKGARRDE